MSGKAAGKKRNRAAQSEQHGFQQPPSEKAAANRKGEGGHEGQRDRQQLIRKMREREEERRLKEGEGLEEEAGESGQPER
ncbi:MAG: hypothetical protein C4534_10510 [Gaiellales bacterium]|nr:MAG: hypothetical protein C4534_10510 [Gaiellales bacterium]